MDREELERLKKVADSRMAHHRQIRFWFRTQYHTVSRYCRQILDGGDLKHIWPKLDKVMQNMTSLGPHYISYMRADLEIFGMFPQFCAEVRETSKCDRANLPGNGGQVARY